MKVDFSVQNQLSTGEVNLFEGDDSVRHFGYNQLN